VASLSAIVYSPLPILYSPV